MRNEAKVERGRESEGEREMGVRRRGKVRGKNREVRHKGIYEIDSVFVHLSLSLSLSFSLSLHPSGS